MSDHDVHDVQRHTEPFDRLSRLSARMTEILDEDENTDVRAILFLHDAEKGGIQIHGYDGEQGDTEAIGDLMIHMKALLKANGTDLLFMTPDGRLL